MVFDILPTPGFRKNRIGTISNRHQKTGRGDPDRLCVV